jgi:hypothetical protein
MIETVHKTLKAVQSGANENQIRSVMAEYDRKLQEIRKNPPTRATTPIPTRPSRGGVRFVMTERRPPQEPMILNNKNVLRGRTVTTTKIPKSIQRPIDHEVSHLNALEVPPTFNAPSDFRPSPLYGMTMDKSNEFDVEEIEKVFDTFTPSPKVQNGFFPVIENGTPSTML